MSNTSLAFFSPTKSLTLRFALLMGISGLLFGIVVTGLLEWRLEKYTFNAQQESLKVAANELGGRLVNDLSARKREIELAAGLIEKTHLNDAASLRALLEKLASDQSSYAWLGLTDAAGKVVVATRRLLEGESVADRSWFAGAQKGPYFGEPHPAKLLERYLQQKGSEPLRFIDVAVPVRDEQGGRRGILGAHLHVSWLKGMTEQIARDLHSVVPIQFFIVDANGAILLSPDGVRLESSEDLLDLAHPSSQFLTVHSAVPTMSSTTGLGWTIVARQSLADVMAPIHQVRSLMLWLALGLGCAFCWLAWLIARQVVRPIADFSEEARKFQAERGEPFRTEVESRQDEVGSLARTMSELVDRLQTHARQNRLLIEHAPAALAMFDTEMRYLAVSQRWRVDYGLGKREIIGRSHYAIFPDWPTQWHEFHRRALAGEVVRADEDRLLRPDGSVQWLRWEMRPWLTHTDVVGGILIFSEDISARKQAETELHENRERLRKLVRSIPDLVWLKDPDGVYLACNLRFEQYFGASESQILGKTDYDFMDRQRADHYRIQDRKAVETRGPCVNEEEIVFGSDGHSELVQAITTPIFSNGGDLVGVLGIARDITQLRRNEEELETYRHHLEDLVNQRTAELAGLAAELSESEARFREMADAAPVLIWMAGLDKLCFYFNQSWLRFTGRSMAEELGNGWVEGVHPDDLPACLQIYSTAFDARESFSMEYRLRHRGGDYRWILDHGAPRFDGNNNFLGYIGACIDIDTIKQAEAEREEGRKAIEQLARRKSDFLANMSHEIRTPLNGVLGMAQIGYRDSVGRGKAQETFSRILESGKLLLTIINDILDFSKIESGRLTVESVPIDPVQLVEQCTQGMLALATAKNLQLVSLCEALPPAVLGDPVRVSQILYNLLSNAIKFTQQGEVRLQARCGDGMLLFMVSDTGVGIAPEVQKRLFQPFEQGESSTARKFGGTGLGLSISRHLAELMGGSLDFVSVVGVGSTFTLQLPLRVTDLPVNADKVQHLTSGKRLAGMHLLVAEDNSVNQLVLEDLLRGEGAEVVMASNGQEAVAHVSSVPRPFDAVLMDVQMPVMDGLEATRCLHRMHPGLPVIGQTAHALQAEHEKCFAAGMVAMVNKPIDLEILVSTLLEHCAAGAAAPVRPVSVEVQSAATSMIDWPAFRARYPGRPDFIKRLIQLFVQRHADDAEHLLAMSQAQDLAGLERLSHDLKGAAGNLFAVELLKFSLPVLESSRNHQAAACEQARDLAAAVERTLAEFHEFMEAG